MGDCTRQFEFIDSCGNRYHLYVFAGCRFTYFQLLGALINVYILNIWVCPFFLHHVVLLVEISFSRSTLHWSGPSASCCWQSTKANNKSKRRRHHNHVHTLLLSMVLFFLLFLLQSSLLPCPERQGCLLCLPFFPTPNPCDLALATTLCPHEKLLLE